MQKAIDVISVGHLCMAGKKWQCSCGRSTGTEQGIDLSWNESVTADGNLNFVILQCYASIKLIKWCIDVHQNNMIAMMVSLQCRLEMGSDEDWEWQFYTHTLQCLATASGQHMEIEEWMVTSLDFRGAVQR